MITVIEAKKILGEKYSKLTDQEIEKILVFIYSLCKRIINEVINNNQINCVDNDKKCYN